MYHSSFLGINIFFKNYFNGPIFDLWLFYFKFLVLLRFINLDLKNIYSSGKQFYGVYVYKYMETILKSIIPDSGIKLCQ